MGGADGFTLHETARRHLFRQWLRPERFGEFRAASERLVGYFEQVSTGMGEDAREEIQRQSMFHRIGVDTEKGFAEFEALCRRARHQLRLAECASLIRLVHEYDAILAAHLLTRLAYHEGKLAADLRDWRRARELLDAVARTENTDTELRVKALKRLGFVCSEQRELTGAIGHYEEALRMTRANGVAGGQIAWIVMALGEAHRDRGDLSRAEELLTDALGRAKATTEPGTMASVYNSLGTLYLRQREMNRAIEAFGRGLEALDQSGDLFRGAQIYNNLGMAYVELRDWKRAEQFYEKSLAIKRQAGDTLGQAKTLNNLVPVYRNLMEESRAIEACTQAIRLFEEIHDLHNVAEAKRNLGRSYQTMNKVDFARAAFVEAMELFRHCGASEEAESTREEMERLGRRERLPWWMWLAIGLTVVFGIVAGLGFVIMVLIRLRVI
jgi:tetratricopeptide (TPR) repeat protein